MGKLLFLASFVVGALLAALLLLVLFFLLPWARDRVGGYALGLFPLSTFAGAFLGWVVVWLFIKAVEA